MQKRKQMILHNFPLKGSADHSAKYFIDTLPKYYYHHDHDHKLYCNKGESCVIH